jgi:hypothetical protein
VLAREVLFRERLDQLERPRARRGEGGAGGAAADDGDRAAIAHAEEQHGEGLRRVDEGPRGLEPEARGAGGHLVHLELAADLGEDHLALRDAEAPPELGEADHLLADEAGVDLDAIEEPVVVGDVLDGAEVEPLPELAVHAREEVLGERGAVPRLVVVGSLERAHVLHQVDAEEHVVAGREVGRHAIEEAAHLLRIEVADGAPEEHEDERRQVAEQRKGALVRGGDAAHLEVRMLARQRGARLPQHVAADVDGEVLRRAAAGRPGAEEVARLDGAAGAELDQRRTVGEGADLGRVLREEHRLRARLVVLRLVADALEDVASLRIVEVATVEPPRMIREPSDDRLSEARARLFQ